MGCIDLGAEYEFDMLSLLKTLSQHIFQKHPWLRDTSILTSSVEERPVFDELWNAAQSDYDYGVVDELWNIQQSDDRVIDV